MIIFFILLISISQFVFCSPHVSGDCGQPTLPQYAHKKDFLDVSAQKNRFQNNQIVIIGCKENEVFYYEIKLQCKFGKWIGNEPRCATNMNAQVIFIEITGCPSSGSKLLFSGPIIQNPDIETLNIGPFNAFHNKRVPEESQVFVEDAKCYQYKFDFDRPVLIWSLVVDIWVDRNQTTNPPIVEPIINEYRTCILTNNSTIIDKEIPSYQTFGYYFICDLKTDSDYYKEVSKPTKSIIFNITTDFLELLELDAIFIKQIYTTNSTNGTVGPECGKIQEKTIGLDINKKLGYYYISCNKSFDDLNAYNATEFAENGNPVHRFYCNWNGYWTGDWPICFPKTPCPTDVLLKEIDGSVIIEEFGNVYYFNESQWFAIEDSFVRYACVDENRVMIGQNISYCNGNGTWSTNMPSCALQFEDSSIRNGLVVTGTVISILVLIVTIVFFVYQIRTKLLKRNAEIDEKIKNSDEYYEVVRDSIYNPMDDINKTDEYESIDYNYLDQIRYEVVEDREPEYLAITEVDIEVSNENKCTDEYILNDQV